MDSEEVERINKNIDFKQFIFAHELLIIGIISVLIEYFTTNSTISTIKITCIYAVLYLFALYIWKFVTYKGWNLKIIKHGMTIIDIILIGVIYRLLEQLYLLF